LHTPGPESTRSSLKDLKRQNERRVFGLLRVNPTMTRAALAGATGLSRSTIGNVIRSLEERGILEEGEHTGARHGLTGRPAVAVALVPGSGATVGVAINRERLKVGVADLRGTVLAEHDEALAPGSDGETILVLVADRVRAMISDLGIPPGRVIGLAIGIPGPVDEDGSIDARSPSPRWAGVRVRETLSHLLDGLPVVPDNDANYGAVGELHFGAGRDVADLVYVSIGPGIGGGFVVAGQLRRGHSGYAGEVGHITAVEDGPRCTCGRTGCLSTVAASGVLLDAWARDRGERLTVSGLLELADAGDAHAQPLLFEAGVHVGRVCGGLVNALDPARVVLGGELGSRSSSLLDGVCHALARYAHPVLAGVDVVHAELQDRSEVLGAVAAVLRDDELVSSVIVRS
jgi:predicted NBD/HSP70 family sugar kinase